VMSFLGGRDISDEKSSSAGCSSEDGSSSPAPYATTTLATGSRTHLSGLVS